jgi:hypothetical protein
MPSIEDLFPPDKFGRPYEDCPWCDGMGGDWQELHPYNPVNGAFGPHVWARTWSCEHCAGSGRKSWVSE